MSRRIARQMALQTLFQLEFDAIGAEDAFLVVQQEQDEKISDNSVVYADALIKGVIEKQEEIDKSISAFAKDWDILRLNKIDLGILRIAIYEMCFAQTALMPNIAINEAVEIAKAYGDDESPRFINGILGKVVRTQLQEDSKKDVSGH